MRPAPAAAIRAGPLPVLCEAGLDAAVFLLLPLLALASRGLAALAAVAGLLALGLGWRAAAWRRLAGSAALFAALVAWGAASAAWSIDPARSLVLAARLLGLSAAGLALVAAAGQVSEPLRLVRAFVAGAALAIVLLAVQRATGGLLTRPFFVRPFAAPALNQASDTLAILVLPTAAALYRHAGTAAALVALAAAVATICALVGDAAKGSLVLALAVAGLCWLRPGPAMRLFAAAAVVLIMTAPLTFPRLAASPTVMHAADQMKSSVSHRLLIWSFVGAHIDEKPLAGWGLDSSRNIPGGKRLIRPGQQWLPLHPHNAPLQLWLELGVPGAALGALIVARLWLGLAAAGWPRLYGAAAAGALAAAATETLGTYGAWQEWWIGTLWLALFLVLVMARCLDAGR